MSILSIKARILLKYEKQNTVDNNIESEIHISGNITHSKYLNLSSVSLNKLITLMV